MIRPEFFIDTLGSYGIDFFAGVPDSLLKNFCAVLSARLDGRHNIVAANEGGAVGLAAGHYLATGRPACVYMQNSGEGNAVNPLASLMDGDVYGLPALLVIGWRGEPGVKDEPQHAKQGKITLSLLDCLGIPYSVLSDDESVASAQISDALAVVNAGGVYALVVRKGTFSAPEAVPAAEPSAAARPSADQPSAAADVPELSRESAIQAVAAALGPQDIVVSTTGMISRELFEYRASAGMGHGHDFLTVGSMGHASQIALGIALERPDRRVCCFDGDGAVLMHMGSMAIVGQSGASNYVHIVFNNGAHDSVGGQPTVGLAVDLCDVARAVGYRSAVRVSTAAELRSALPGLLSGASAGDAADSVAGSGAGSSAAASAGSSAGSSASSVAGPAFLEVIVRKGNRPDLGRPTTTPVQNRDAFMDFLKA
ncbi:MAG: phosphonopyruvate decarboxylase [Candidatus Cryptobacteroides sp.]|nr:phosphonopyruvate decarboxylase [Candidatus Cryptobacteroides sp.]